MYLCESDDCYLLKSIALSLTALLRDCSRAPRGLCWGWGCLSSRPGANWICWQRLAMEQAWWTSAVSLFPMKCGLWSSPDTLVCDQGIKWLEWTSEKYTAEQELQRRQAYNGNKHYLILIHSLQGQTYLLIRLSEAFEQSWGLWNIWFIKKSGICEVYTQQISSKCEAVD